MKKIYIVFIVIIVCLFGLWYFVYRNQQSLSPQADQYTSTTTQTRTNEETQKYADPIYSFSFQYPDRYVFNEPILDSPKEVQLEKTIMLVLQKDYEFMRRAEMTESPPVIIIQVIRNPERLSPAEWARGSQVRSLFGSEVSKKTEILFNGNPAIRFSSDGLYAAQNFVISYGEYMYVLSGQYIDTKSPLYTDFLGIVSSFKFL